MTHLTALICRKGEAAPVSSGSDWSTPALAWDVEPGERFWGSSPDTAIRLPTPKASRPARAKAASRPVARPDEQGRVRLTARLPEQDYGTLRSRAAEQNRPMAALVRDAVAMLLRRS